MDEELAAIRQRRALEMMGALGEAMSSGAAQAEPVEVDETTLKAFLENHPVALVDVWASWCGPCRMMEPIMRELAAEFRGKAAIGKLNADENPDFLAALGIQSIPTFLAFRNGALVGRLVGARPKAEFVQALTRLMHEPEDPGVA